MWKVFESQDGSSTVMSEKYGVSYHSKYGAVQESRHVFISAGLYYKAVTQKKLSILEMGFGTGLNAMITYLEAERNNLIIEYTTVDKEPLPEMILNRLNYSTLNETSGASDIFDQLHSSAWGIRQSLTNHFHLLKLKQSFEEVRFSHTFDLIYYDAFAPTVQPELWNEDSMKQMYDALHPNGILVTYCAKGAFKRALKAVGFKVEALKGPPGKREMTRAIKL